MVLFYMSLILYPENFLSSVWLTGGKLDNRADYDGIYQFWYFSNHEPLFVLFQLIKINWNYRWMQVDLLYINGELVTCK